VDKAFADARSDRQAAEDHQQAADSHSHGDSGRGGRVTAPETNAMTFTPLTQILIDRDHCGPMLGQPEHRVRVDHTGSRRRLRSKLNVYAEEAMMGGGPMKTGKPAIGSSPGARIPDDDHGRGHVDYIRGCRQKRTGTMLG